MATSTRPASNPTATRLKGRGSHVEPSRRQEDEEVVQQTVDAKIDTPEMDEDQLNRLLNDRQGSRRIQVEGESEQATSVKQAVVKTTKGLPDMRFADNRNMYLKDKSKTVKGKPDFRLLNNRPDIVKLHQERGSLMPNVIFSDDGQIDNEGNDE